jgi:hypothetical protein
MIGKYTLLLNRDGIAIGKSLCYIDLSDDEIEITEEQYEQINELPLELTFNQVGELISWTKIILPVEEVPEPVHVPTFEERLTTTERLLIVTEEQLAITQSTLDILLSEVIPSLM